MRIHKVAGTVVGVVALGIKITSHSHPQIFPNFEMEVSRIHVVGPPADCPHFVSPTHLVADSQTAIFQMAVERIDKRDLSVFGPVGMTDDGDVSPALFIILREYDDSMTDGVDRRPFIGISAAVSVPVLSQVAARRIATVDVVSPAVRFPNRIVETIGKLSGSIGLS